MNNEDAMIRIGMFGSSDKLGGTEVYMITMVRELKNKIVFDYLVPNYMGKIPFEEEIIALGGNVYREYYIHRDKNKPDYISPKEIIEKHPEWDGIYLNVQNIHTAYLLLKEAKKKKIPYRIIHAHNNGFPGSLSLKDRVFNVYFNITKRKYVTHFLACSVSAGRWMFGKEENVFVVPNAIDFCKFQMNTDIRNKMRKMYGISDDEIVIGFCGRLCYQKNPEFLLQIFAELKKQKTYKLLLVGSGELEKRLREYAAERGISDKIIFTGAVRNVQDYYQMMDCFVLPSRFEGFGIVLLEAQAAGLRCYTTDCVVPHETDITGRVTFISPEASAAVWAQKIEAEDFNRISCIKRLESSDYCLDSLKKKLYKIFNITSADAAERADN